MRNNGWAKIGYLLAEGDTNAIYFREVLEHLGVRAERFASIADALGCDVVLLLGYGEATFAESTVLSSWVEGGGALVACGSGWGLEELLGLEGDAVHLSSGLLSPCESPLWPEHAGPIRFFGGKFHRAALGSLSDIVTDQGSAAVVSRRFGSGSCTYFAPHLGRSFKLMQLGTSVEVDAAGPIDGSAQLDDGKLRAEDGIALDFDVDRIEVEGTKHKFFGQPHADLLKEVFFRCLLEVVDRAGLRMATVWYWPNHATGAAMVTFDCQDFEVDYVSRMQRMLTMFGSRTTWMVAMPGYPADTYRQMRAWGYEVGLLYDAEDAAGWHPDRLHIQFTSLGRLSSLPNITAVRPADGRWRGYTHFYEAAQDAGCRVSLSKGGRQPGTQGFAFGTCHPFFPARKDGFHLTMEVPYTVYNPGSITLDPVSDVVLLQSALRNGCFHLVSRPEAVLDSACHSALRRTLSLCKQHRLEFLAPEEIYSFEKARRNVRITVKVVGGETLLGISSDVAIDGLSLLISGDRMAAEAKGKEIPCTPIRRFGRTFQSLTMDLEAKHLVEIRLRSQHEVEDAA